MRKPALFIASLLLASCGAPAATIPSVPAESEVSSSPTQQKVLEQIPAELSIDHFSKMRLEGTDFTLGTVQSKNDSYTRYTISYRSNGLLISGIMNIPNGPGPYPLLVFNHGYIAPSVYTNGRGLKREQDYMARQGFAVLHTDYRGHAQSDESPDTTRKIYDAGLEYSMDSMNAVHAVRAAKLPQVDASRVGMLGHSMGGGVTLNILTAYPDFIDAAVLYAPVNGDAWENFWRWRREREEDDRTAPVMKTREENPGPWDRLSSKTYFSNISDPILLFQGAYDKDVPKAWSDDLNADLTELQKDITYVEYASEGHEFGPQWGDFMRKSAAFFKEHLKKID